MCTSTEIASAVRDPLKEDTISRLLAALAEHISANLDTNRAVIPVISVILR